MTEQKLREARELDDRIHELKRLIDVVNDSAFGDDDAKEVLISMASDDDLKVFRENTLDHMKSLLVDLEEKFRNL